jgi:type II secretory pathway predicted ATPase ExeA
LFRPIFLIDEALELLTCNLNELRLTGSARFDSECLLTVILCGNLTLPERFRSNKLLAPDDKKELKNYLEYCLLKQAGGTQLMTKSLVN